MSNNSNNPNPNPNSNNIFNNQSVNFDHNFSNIFNNSNNGNANNGNANVNNEPSPNPEINVSGIKIPRHLQNDFDTIAVHLLSQGSAGTVKLCNQITRIKKIHQGEPREVTHWDLAILLGGYVEFVYQINISCLTSPYVKNASEKEFQRLFCIRHPLLKNKVPFKQAINKFTDVKERKYVNWNTAFFTGLIQSNKETEKEWEEMLQQKKNESVDNHVRKSERDVYKWFPAKEPLHKYETSRKVDRTSKLIENKLDTLDLLQRDSYFAKLWTNNQVSGVQAYKRVLIHKQQREEKGFQTTGGLDYSQINKEVVNDVQTAQIEKMKVQNKIQQKLVADEENVRLQFTNQLILLGISKVEHFNFANMETFMFKSLNLGLEKSLRLISTATKTERERQVLKRCLSKLIENFFKNR